MGDVFIGNTNVLDLSKLKAVIGNAYIDDATVTVTVKDRKGDPVLSSDITFTWPLTLAPTYDSPPVGGYRVTLPDTLLFKPNTQYVAVVDADAGPGRVGHWEFKFVARVRERL